MGLRVFCLFFLSTVAIASENEEKPDLFLSIDSLGVRESGIFKWIRSKYPDFRNWASRIDHNLSYNQEFYDVADLSEEDFTRVEFLAKGLDSFLTEKPDKIKLGEGLSFAVSLSVQEKMEILNFQDRVLEVFREGHSPRNFPRLLEVFKPQSNKLELLFGVSDFNNSTDKTSQFEVDGNFSFIAETDHNSSSFLLGSPREWVGKLPLPGLQKSLEFPVLSQLPQDSQISFACKIPATVVENNLRKKVEVNNPASNLFSGIREIGYAVIFRRNSIFFESVFLCDNNESANSFLLMCEDLIGMGKLLLSQDPNTRPILHLFSQVQLERIGSRMHLSLDLNKAIIEQSISDFLTSQAPLPKAVLPRSRFQSQVQNEAPLFKLPLIGGGELDLFAERGKIVVLDFWATWSGSCGRGLPMVIQAASNFAPSQVLWVAINQGESQVQIKEFLTQFDLLPINVAIDHDSKIGSLYGVEALPHTVLIDKKGMILDVTVGFSPFQGTDLSRKIEKLIK